MKNTLFKLSLLGLALSSITTAYANTDNINPTTIPGFTLNLTGFYLQPGANNLVYAVHTEPLPAPTPDWAQRSVDPDYHPTFDIGLQYTFADSVDQINLDWLYLNTSDSDAASTGGTASIEPPYYFGPLGQVLGNTANSTAQFDVNNINLTLSHLFNVGDHFQFKPFAGLGVADLEEDITSNYTGEKTPAANTDPNAPYSITSYNTSQFIGAGPRLGLNTTYLFTNYFGLVAEVAGSVLAGSVQTDTNFNSSLNHATPNYTTLADQTQTRIVPEVDAKLGLTYTIPFRTNKSSLNIQTGYMVTAYINGITQVVPTALVPDAFSNGTVAVETEGQNESDLDLNGPYLQIAYTF